MAKLVGWQAGAAVLALTLLGCGDFDPAGKRFRCDPVTGADCANAEAPPDGGDAGALDAGADAGAEPGADAGVDAGFDAGEDAGADAGWDAGADAGWDAGLDAGADAGFIDGGTDAGTDAGAAACAPLQVPGCSSCRGDSRDIAGWGNPTYVAGHYGHTDLHPTISGDGLTLCFASYLPGNFDIYCSVRPRQDAGFTTPVRQEGVTTDAGEYAPELSADGLELWFARQDAWNQPELHKAPRGADGGFGPAVKITPFTGSAEFGPSLSCDGTELVFRSSFTGSGDLYRVTRPASSGPFAGPAPLTWFNTVSREDRASVARDGMLMVVARGNLAYRSERQPDGGWSPTVEFSAGGMTPDMGELGMDGRLYFSAWNVATGSTDIFSADPVP